MSENWICRKCGVALIEKKVVFDYLGHSVSQDMLQCPKCGKTLVPQELAQGKMSEVETMLEDK